MDNLITAYQERLNLQNATFSRIDHEDATVAIVYKITQPANVPLILKVCIRPNDYLHEVYFLKYFADILPVPQIVHVVQPEPTLHGAILMECLPGTPLKTRDFNDARAYEIGSLLARIHLNRTAGYGDLTQPNNLTLDPRVSFTQKFEEGLAECENHLPKTLIEQCRSYYNAHINLLTSADGPCITHRDFRAGNVIIDQGKLLGIIDWSSARAGFAQEDFCPLEHGGWPANPNAKESFFAGYASIRPVPDYKTMIPLLRLSRAIAIIGFTVKRETWNGHAAQLYQLNRQFLDMFF
ncbi:phosphotransferase [Candidatus Babeliales bacterium]|nr:phosphotransferase [Candidatus Babeliales bacterium]